MKISEMLQREDFYSILPHTLNRYANFLDLEPGSVEVVDKGKWANLYINEYLNAIIAAKPSKEVKDYLKTEFSVGGSTARRAAVSAYLNLATSFVRMNSQRGLKIGSKQEMMDLLIYPCNKKIRIFDFSSGIVYTVLKDGFPEHYLKRETEFRLSANQEFVPKILNYTAGCYSEKIIRNGKPLARIQDVDFVEMKKRESLRLIASLTKVPRHIFAKAYVNSLKERCLNMLAAKDGFCENARIIALFDRWLHSITNCPFELVTSHGDLQPGNIWIDSYGQIVIIDWETVKQRSTFYDYATLYCRLRNHGGLQGFCNRVKSDGCLSGIKEIPFETVLALILAEEMEYQTEELISFPGKMGIDYYLDRINEFEHTEI